MKNTKTQKEINELKIKIEILKLKLTIRELEAELSKAVSTPYIPYMPAYPSTTFEFPTTGTMFYSGE